MKARQVRTMRATRVHIAAVMLAAAWLGATWTALAQSPATAGDGVVKYTPAGELIKPADFREWVFLSSGLGMTYTPPNEAAAAASRPPSFTNVYVNPASYRAFMKSGTWPDQTMFILEIRGSASEGSINLGGRYQTELRAIEAEVKDSSKPGTWAFYNFGATADKVAALPTSAPCYSCHGANTAVEHTFVQFYPTLLEVAKAKGTLNARYLAGEKTVHP